MGTGALATTLPRHGHSTATARPGVLRYGRGNGLRYSQPACGACGSASCHGLVRERVTIQNFVSWLRGDLVSRYNATRGCDTGLNALRHGAGALQHARQRSRHGARQERGSRYNFCIVTEGRDTALRHGVPARACAQRHGRTRPRYGRGGGHVTAQRKPRHGSQHADGR